jgi:AhpD family alkylhydroperoxidase
MRILMPRIPFADIASPIIGPLVTRIVAERGAVLDLYRVLLQSPPVAAGWLYYLSAIRRHCALPGRLRELVIMRVAILTGASYEAEQHAQIALTEGLTAAQLDALDEWEESSRFDARERAVLAYTDAMTAKIRVANDIFAAVRRHFDDRLVVELTATIAAYNMVSRVLEALEIRGGGTPVRQRKARMTPRRFGRRK